MSFMDAKPACRRVRFVAMRCRTLIAAAALAFLAAPPAASAATLAVAPGASDSTLGTCSATRCSNLRAAITYANSHPGTVLNLAAGSYVLSVDELLISANVTINGAGPSATKIQQTNPNRRVLELGSGVNVILTGLELTGGHITCCDPGSPGGGGILDQGNALSLTGVRIDHNEIDGTDGPINAGDGGQAAGGAITKLTGSLDIERSTLSDNIVRGGAGQAFANAGGQGGNAEGGAVDAFGAGLVTISDSTIARNVVIGGAGGSTTVAGQAGDGGGAYGGGVALHSSALLVSDLMISNTATGGAAGVPASGTKVGAAGNADGGGVATTFQFGLVDSTVTANAAGGGQGILGQARSQGGGLYLGSSDRRLAGDTIVANSAGTGTFGNGHGGNLLFNGGMTTSIADTIVARGTATTGPNCDTGSSISLAPHTVDDIEDTSPSQCGFSATTGDRIGADPKLSPLADNGGPTQTMALLPSSPAIGLGVNCPDLPAAPQAPYPPITADQRGEPRPAVCDAGAFQHQPVSITSTPSVLGTPIVGRTLICRPGAATGDGLAFSYRWLVAGGTAPGQSYKLRARDAGRRVACRMTVSGTYGPTEGRTSASVKVVTAGVLSIPAQRPKVARDGTVAITLACSKAGRCAGTVAITVIRTRKPKLIVLGSRSFAIPPGRTTVRLKLTAAGLALVKARRGPVQATIRASGAHRRVQLRH